MVNQTAAQMRIPSDQWRSFRFVFFNFAVDVVDDAAGSSEGVEPAEGEGSMLNGMEIEETKESSQGETNWK